MALSCPASWRSCGRASPGSLRRPGRTTVTTLDNHILPVLRDKRVEETRPRLVGAFLRHLQDEKGLSAATARKARTVLSAVLSYAVAMEYVESNAAMKVPPPETHATERVAPTLEETARILLEAEINDPEFLTFLWVAAETGVGGARRLRCVGEASTSMRARSRSTARCRSATTGHSSGPGPKRGSPARWLCRQ